MKINRALVFGIIFLIGIVATLAACGKKKSTKPEHRSGFYIELTPRSSSMAQGAHMVLAASINDVSNFFAGSFEISFDRNIIGVDSVVINQSSIIGNQNSIVFFSHTNSGISVGLGRTQTSDTDSFSGSGPLFDIFVEGIKTGSTSIEWNDILIIDEKGLPNPSLSQIQKIPASISVR